MIAEVASKRNEIAAICRRFGVRRLELFGSAARGHFDLATSDFDFIYEFDDANEDLLRRFIGLGDALEALLGRPVDFLSEQRRSNPYLWASIDRDREVIYGAGDRRWEAV